MPRTEKWSLKFDRCVQCGRNDIKHVARGLCIYCYRQETEKRIRGKQREKYGLVSKTLNYEYLHEEYVNKNRSLSDIAKDCDCGRQYVYKKMKEFNIPLRTQKEARELVYDRQKISYTKMDENGNERLVIPVSIKVNEKFFSSWTKEMAYTLGVIYTDGNLYSDRDRRIYRLSISQKEPELLNKVLKLMDCNARLYHKRKHGISGDLYFFSIHNQQMYADLINLGLSPNKSKTIEFPNIPSEFVRHFIRGCWDGDGSFYIFKEPHFVRSLDGSVFLEKRRHGQIKASYTSGSLKFIESLVIELEKAGLTKKEIYRTKSKSPSYYVSYGKDNSIKLYHYLYDGVSAKQYLSRKYKVLKKYFSKLEQKVQNQQIEL